jgi:hypothetical protein
MSVCVLDIVAGALIVRSKRHHTHGLNETFSPTQSVVVEIGLGLAENNATR